MKTPSVLINEYVNDFGEIIRVCDSCLSDINHDLFDDREIFCFHREANQSFCDNCGIGEVQP